MALSEAQILNRTYWVEKIQHLNGDFMLCVGAIQTDLQSELEDIGLEALIGHLEFCGVIPEAYGYDSTQEKLYSKYTDILIALAFEQLGITSLVLTERSNTADVECVTKTMVLWRMPRLFV
jgi:HindIII restriction endonuclease